MQIQEKVKRGFPRLEAAMGEVWLSGLVKGKV